MKFLHFERCVEPFHNTEPTMIVDAIVLFDFLMLPSVPQVLARVK